MELDWFFWISCSSLGLLAFGVFRILLLAAGRWSLIIEYAPDMQKTATEPTRRSRRRRHRGAKPMTELSGLDASTVPPATPTPASAAPDAPVTDPFSSPFMIQPPGPLSSTVTFECKQEDSPAPDFESFMPKTRLDFGTFDMSSDPIQGEQKAAEKAAEILPQLIPFEKHAAASVFDPADPANPVVGHWI